MKAIKALNNIGTLSTYHAGFADVNPANYNSVWISKIENPVLP